MSLPPPACEEVIGGSWDRAAGIARTARSKPGKLGRIEQPFEAAPAKRRLRFLGSHLFDLLDKLLYEGGGGELERRRVICGALNAVAAQGAPVIRLWGSLKRTGTSDEVRTAATLLELVLDENARRKRPLRFVIALLNHQAGYGSPMPDRSLDDQPADHPWNARSIYLKGSWQSQTHGLLAERIRHFGERPAIQGSPYVIAWELVNELDTFRGVAGGSLAGPEADALRDSFLVPAMKLLAETFPQPLMIADIRGSAGAYTRFGRGLIEALPPGVRERLAWTSHVYAVKGDPAATPPPTWKLDLDLEIAAAYGMPLLVGEIGQFVRGGEARFCKGGVTHDIGELFRTVFEAPARGSRGAARRGKIEAAVFWGEGQCRMPVPGSTGNSWVSIGAGGDSADLGPDELEARSAVTALRRLARFQAAPE
jgi:hypothetical protein